PTKRKENTELTSNTTTITTLVVFIITSIIEDYYKNFSNFNLKSTNKSILYCTNISKYKTVHFY
ncbi:MAG: hypothetical protein ACRD6Q_02815, partial [Nitrososphaeraceae archaeon]